MTDEDRALIEAVHEAMQAAPQDGIPYRMARAAIAAVRYGGNARMRLALEAIRMEANLCEKHHREVMPTTVRKLANIGLGRPPYDAAE